MALHISPTNLGKVSAAATICGEMSTRNQRKEMESGDFIDLFPPLSFEGCLGSSIRSPGWRGCLLLRDVSGGGMFRSQSKATMWGVLAFGLGEFDAVVGAWIGWFRKLLLRSSRRVSSTAALPVLRGSSGGIGTILGV